MEEKNCLTCKYEPAWSEWSGGEYSRCYGECRYVIKLPVLPSFYRCYGRDVVRYNDDSGIETHCKAWKKKINM